MVVLGINSRAACFSHFHPRHCEINFFERRRRARIDAENGHRRVTRPRLRIIVTKTQGYPTGNLRASSDTIKCDPEQHELKQVRDKSGAVFAYIPGHTCKIIVVMTQKKMEFYVNMCFSDERGVIRGEVTCFLVREAFAQSRTPLQGATSSHSARGRPTGQSRRERVPHERHCLFLR